MDKKNRNTLLTAGAAVSLAAAGAAAHKNAAYIQAERVRMLFRRNDEIRDRGLTEPEDIVKVKDLAYGKDPEQVLDIYYPVGTKEPLPTIVSVHGGAYVYGSKELYRFYCMSLAQRGFAVVNFSYRLAPKYRFPAQLQDTNSVMRYVCEHAGENFIDTGRVFMAGDSAGAQLASQYAAAVTNPAYADILNMEIPKFRLRACAFNCGLYRPDPRRDKLMLKRYFDDTGVLDSEQMDVFEHITKDYPPVFIMSSNGDFLLDRVEDFADLLSMKGIENEVRIYSPKDRKLGHVFHCNMKEPYAKQCNDEECAFYRKHLNCNSFT